MLVSGRRWIIFHLWMKPYKVELINDLEDGTITYYRQGDFTDLCRGPHLPNTSYIKAIKLTSVAGAYWRGNEHNKMLTRVYGITFPKQKMLEEWVQMMEEVNCGITGK